MPAPSSDRAGIRQVIRALRAADHIIYGGNDSEDEFTVAPNASEDVILDHLMVGDEGSLFVKLPPDSGRETSFIYFVFGNEPEEVICDHGVSLSPVLDPLTEGWWE